MPTFDTIVGHGIDLVDTARIARMVTVHGQHFLDRVFTCQEQDYCLKSAKRSHEHLAGRFAVKEAVLKAIGTGWRGGIAWTDVEVRIEESGKPYLQLTGESKAIADKLGINKWLISISHIETHATGSAIAVSSRQLP